MLLNFSDRSGTGLTTLTLAHWHIGTLNPRSGCLGTKLRKIFNFYLGNAPTGTTRYFYYFIFIVFCTLYKCNQIKASSNQKQSNDMLIIYRLWLARKALGALLRKAKLTLRKMANDLLNAYCQELMWSYASNVENVDPYWGLLKECDDYLDSLSSSRIVCNSCWWWLLLTLPYW